MDIYQEIPWKYITATQQPAGQRYIPQEALRTGNVYDVQQAFYGRAIKQGEPFGLDPRREGKWQLAGRLDAVRGHLKKISSHVIEFVPRHESRSAYLPRGLFAVTIKDKGMVIASGFQFFEVRR